MELRSLEILDENNEVVELVVGDTTIAQAVVTSDDGEYIITKLHVLGEVNIGDVILQEYLQNPPS